MRENCCSYLCVYPSGPAQTHVLFCNFFPYTICTNALYVTKHACRHDFLRTVRDPHRGEVPGKQRKKGPAETVNSPAFGRHISAWHRAKGCMTSGGHYVSKILPNTRNPCISCICSFLHLMLPLKSLLLGVSRLRRMGGLGLVCRRSGSWDHPPGPLAPGPASPFASRSFPCTRPAATSRWRCGQVRLPRCDLHKPLKALNIYPQNSIKLFIKSNA